MGVRGRPRRVTALPTFATPFVIATAFSSALPRSAFPATCATVHLNEDQLGASDCVQDVRLLASQGIVCLAAATLQPIVAKTARW